MKVLRDFRRATTTRYPLSGCLWSVICRVRSVRLVTALLVSGGAIPASMGRLLVFVFFRQPVIIRQVSFSVAFSLFAWVERNVEKGKIKTKISRQKGKKVGKTKLSRQNGKKVGKTEISRQNEINNRENGKNKSAKQKQLNAVALVLPY